MTKIVFFLWYLHLEPARCSANSCDRYKLQIKAMGVEKSTKYTISWGDIELVPKNRQFRGFQFAHVFDAFSIHISHIS